MHSFEQTAMRAGFQKAELAVPACRILLVEDYQDIADMLRMLLESAGYRVVLAASVAEASSRVRQEKFDLVISDIRLPDGSGLQLMRQIRRSAGINCRTPGIALSGYDDPEHVHASLDAGFAVHLVKSIEESELFAAISRTVNGGAE